MEPSKFLSYVLRREPQAIGLTLDTEGWANILPLNDKASAAGHQLNPDLISADVAGSGKKTL
jgi:putative RNA 2'-phosphotransferase